MWSFSGKCFFVTFIDDYMHFTVVFPIKKKSKVPEKFKEFLKSLSLHTVSVNVTLG